MVRFLQITKGGFYPIFFLWNGLQVGFKQKHRMQIVSFSPEILPFCVVGGPLSWSEGPVILGNPTGCKRPYNFMHRTTGCGDFAKGWHEFLVESGHLEGSYAC